MPTKAKKSRQSASETLSLKLASFHRYLLDSCAPRTLKDLEKNPPSTAPKIRGAEIKDLLNSLLADDLIKCEKIGSGNWYWAFASDAAKARAKALDAARSECKRLEDSVAQIEQQVKRRSEAFEGGADTARREELAEEHRALAADNERMAGKVREHARSGAGEVHAKKEDLPRLVAMAERWEDNMAILEGYVVRLSGGDRSVLVDVRKAIHGEEDGEEEDEPPAKRAKTEAD